MGREPNMIEVALFPIPGSINFPGVVCPLHVFEPRYRKMVRYCLDEERLMGVCHTEKVVHARDRQQSLEEALQSNQATYKPCTIFSAGAVKLIDELPDGRMVIEIDMCMRLQLHSEKQVLPFNIWACQELSDQVLSEQSQLALAQLQEKILQRLIVMSYGNDPVQAVFRSETWTRMPAEEFSFAILGLMSMEPDAKQWLLEQTDPGARLKQVLTMLNTNVI